MTEKNPHFYEWKDLRPDLIDKCTTLIDGICQSEKFDFHALWWEPGTMTKIVQVDGTRELLKIYNKAWRQSTRLKAGVRLSAMLMAAEVLSSGMFGWDVHDPAACAVARRLMTRSDGSSSHRMLEFFRVIDNEEMGEAWHRTVEGLLSAPS